MDIKIKEFLLTPSLNSPTRFDLQREITRTKRESTETYRALEDLGYGMSLPSCIEHIISIKLTEKEDIVTLKEFITEYKNERDLILKETDLTINNVKQN